MPFNVRSSMAGELIAVIEIGMGGTLPNGNDRKSMHVSLFMDYDDSYEQLLATRESLANALQAWEKAILRRAPRFNVDQRG